MPALSRILPLLGLLILATPAPSPAAEARRFAVRLPAAGDELAAAVRGGAFNRWIVARDEGVELALGPDAAGDVVVEARLFPVDEGLAARLDALPVSLRGEAITLAGTAYRDRRHALAVRLPEAERPTWVVAGYSVEATASLVDQVLIAAAGRRWGGIAEDVDYLLREHRYFRRSGRWRADAEGRTVADDERDDFAARAAAYSALHPLNRRHLVLRVDAARAADPEMTALADTLDDAAAAMAARIPLRLERPIEVVVESDFVTQGRHLGDIGAAVLDPGGRSAEAVLHIVHHPDDGFAYRHGVARALLHRATLELPPWLDDGAALWLSVDWYGRPYHGWLADLAGLEALPTADDLLVDARQDDGSAVLWPPAAAAVVGKLPGTTLRQKLGTPPSPAAVAASLDRLRAAPGRPRRGTVQTAAAPRSFARGVSLAMANGLEVGYHAPGIDDQLARLRRLGADSVSLMPFAYQPSPVAPELSFLNRSPSSETDVGTLHAARRARAHGFSVLWKPHIWVSHSSWPGEIAMASEADWTAWWRVYRRFVLHHAVLAEWADSELFSIGVELGKTVDREAEWRSLIGAVRRLYSGRLTYSGNWAGDYDRVPFWDALDLIGVDAYFPLADRPDADRRLLAAGARRTARGLEAAAQRFAKPVLLTEVGFAAREGTWIAPHEEGGTVSEAHQALAYEALLDTLGRPPWLAGLYVWKVFSHPSVEGRERPDFRVLGRRAETVIRGYFLGPGADSALTAR